MKAELVRPPETGLTPAQFKRACEQVDYLEGIIWSDPVHRLDMDPTRDVGQEIDPYGTHTKAFWRAAIETGGKICVNGGRNKYASVSLRGSYRFLKKFMAFLTEELGPTFDGNGQLDFACSSSRIHITGPQAITVCRLLYIGQEIGVESVRRVVDEIIV